MNNCIFTAQAHQANLQHWQRQADQVLYIALNFLLKVALEHTVTAACHKQKKPFTQNSESD